MVTWSTNARQTTSTHGWSGDQSPSHMTDQAYIQLVLVRMYKAVRKVLLSSKAELSIVGNLLKGATTSSHKSE